MKKSPNTDEVSLRSAKESTRGGKIVQPRENDTKLIPCGSWKRVDNGQPWQEYSENAAENHLETVNIESNGKSRNNSDFGRKTAKLIYSSVFFDDHVQVATNDYAVFFPKLATNHGGAGNGDNNSPNWFYYWKDGGVCGIASNVVYDDTNTDFGFTTPATSSQVTLGQAAPTTNTGPETYTATATYGSVTVTGHGKGIKCVAETIQHEQHHLDIYNWYHTGIVASPATDADGDGIPATNEATLDGINSDPSNSNTFNMGGSYATSNYADNEIRARKVELLSTIAIHPESDWAVPGAQWSPAFGP